MTRRALLIMPVAFGGLMLMFWRRERKLPDAALDGTGEPVDLLLFSNKGQRLGVSRVRKIVKSPAEWQRELLPDEFTMSRLGGTELAYTGRYWKANRPGIYRCVCCGNALFLSHEKYDSETGWPSFWGPAAAENIRTARDTSLAIERTEVLCAKCDGHLGHVFDDGPPPTGLRYCLNSAALRLVEGP